MDIGFLNHLTDFQINERGILMKKPLDLISYYIDICMQWGYSETAGKANKIYDKIIAWKWINGSKEYLNDEEITLENVDDFMNPEILKEIITTPMPFGKYEGTMIADLPMSYLEWFSSQGFPKGKLGMLLATTFEIKTNGLQEIIDKLKHIN